MGLTKQYLRYVAAGNFNIIASAGCNAVFITLEGQEGRFVGVAACEDIIIWDMRLGEKVIDYIADNILPSFTCLTFFCILNISDQLSSCYGNT